MNRTAMTKHSKNVMFFSVLSFRSVCVPGAEASEGAAYHQKTCPSYGRAGQILSYFPRGINGNGFSEFPFVYGAVRVQSLCPQSWQTLS